MVILVTGFEPFGGIEVNPSQAIVESLGQDSASRRHATLVTEVLPTEFRAAGDRIVALIREHRPDAVLSIGLAASAASIRLERVALNLNDALRPDNGGDLATGRLIDPAGPIGYWSTLPLDAHAAGAEGARHPVGHLESRRRVRLQSRLLRGPTRDGATRE